MNKKAGTESNTSFAVIELIIAIPIAIMLVGLIFMGFKLVLQDDVSSQVYTTAITQTDVLIDELQSREESTILGSYPVQVHGDAYITVDTEKSNSLCLYSYPNNKRIRCTTFTDVSTITITGGIIPQITEDITVRSSVELLQISLKETTDNKFTLNYALQ